MVDGRTQLADWIARRGVNQREAARILGMNFTNLNHLLNGRRRAGLAVAIQIERCTGIPAESWLPTDDGKSDEPALVERVKR